ncbi:hypothetical protein [Mixta intestinalis]|jgi:hypothetical protein|uniref:DUF2158 domain-containing protein n=1 Tax=Mixta intestinalis TaxID=1615494 RepID=A0A6P1PX06_9GAMM|nr:hypothetical protein [Mixta intestinalis]QHM70652.1 hypothetical protein C7M51_00930 [Mixta intestinalis]
MSKYAKGTIVKHQSGEIRVMVIAVFSQGDFSASYQVRWDDAFYYRHPAF